MASSPVTAEFAQTEVSALLDQAAYHKRQVRVHRKKLSECMSEVERLRREAAERLGLEVHIVPQAHSQEAQSNEHHTHP